MHSIFSSFSLSVTIVKRVASLPVSAVVGIAMTGRPGMSLDMRRLVVAAGAAMDARDRHGFRAVYRAAPAQSQMTQSWSPSLSAERARSMHGTSGSGTQCRYKVGQGMSALASAFIRELSMPIAHEKNNRAHHKGLGETKRRSTSGKRSEAPPRHA